MKTVWGQRERWTRTYRRPHRTETGPILRVSCGWGTDLDRPALTPCGQQGRGPAEEGGDRRQEQRDGDRGRTAGPLDTRGLSVFSSLLCRLLRASMLEVPGRKPGRLAPACGDTHVGPRALAQHRGRRLTWVDLAGVDTPSVERGHTGAAAGRSVHRRRSVSRLEANSPSPRCTLARVHTVLSHVHPPAFTHLPQAEQCLHSRPSCTETRDTSAV